MRTIKQEDYSKLNRALYELEDLLECMGVKEFSLSNNRHDMKIDTGSDKIDTELIYLFCQNIDRIYDQKFGGSLTGGIRP
jgi:hypothetical protein